MVMRSKRLLGFDIAETVFGKKAATQLVELVESQQSLDREELLEPLRSKISKRIINIDFSSGYMVLTDDRVISHEGGSTLDNIEKIVGNLLLVKYGWKTLVKNFSIDGCAHFK
mgnify:CR=1 FL=1